MFTKIIYLIWNRNLTYKNITAQRKSCKQKKKKNNHNFYAKHLRRNSKDGSYVKGYKVNNKVKGSLIKPGLSYTAD